MGLLLGSGITRPKYPYDMWYGVEGDYSSSDYKLKRVGNLDLHRSLPIQSRMKRFVENPDGSVKYYLHPNDSRKKEGGVSAVLDTTDGNVMLEIPEFYFRLEISGTKWIYAISEYPLPGFVKIERKTIAPWYSTIDTVKNEAVSGCFLRWDGNEVARDSNGLVQFSENAVSCRGGAGDSDASMDGTHSSQLGMGRTTINKSVVRTYCKNGTHIGAYRAYNTIAWLQRIEYASLNSQDVYIETLSEEGFRQGGLGSGCGVNGAEWNTWGVYRPFIPGGVTAVLGNNTGKVSYTVKGWTGGDKAVQVTSYRGFEVPFEYLLMLADDVLVYNSPDSAETTNTVYVCDDPTKFATPSNSATIAPDGYVAIAGLPRSSGYVGTYGISVNGYSFPDSLGGAYNKGCCDYFYAPDVSDSGWYGAFLAAHATYGAYAGLGYLTTTSRSSYAYMNIGFRLCRF